MEAVGSGSVGTVVGLAAISRRDLQHCRHCRLGQRNAWELEAGEHEVKWGAGQIG